MIILIIGISIILLLVISAIAFMCNSEPATSDYCKSCRYRCRNCTQEPCIVCEAGSEWEKSELDDQEDFD